MKKRWLKSSLSILLMLVIISFMIPTTAMAKSSDNIIRYSIVVLDSSGSMRGEPHSLQNVAAKKFCESVLSASGKNYVAIAKINTYSSKVSDFTNDINVLNSAIDSIGASGGTNINEALNICDELLNSIENTDNVVKNIVLCSDGLPESGQYKSTGNYTYDDSWEYYGYANAAYDTATEIKGKGVNIYTLGFFHSLTGGELKFGQLLMNDLQNAGYYEVVDPEQLVFTFGEIAGDITNKATGKFKYASGNEKDYSADFYYDDNYFSIGASTYQESLATMSLCFELSAFGSNETDYNYKYRNAEDLLKQCGFEQENIEANQYFKQRPEEDSMGVIIGSKKIHVNNKDYTLIALATRGGGYEAEWAGNFTIGMSGRHEGFRRSSEEAKKFLASYINNHKKDFCDDVKVWIAGYSRGAITANLVAADITKEGKISDVPLEKENIYAYCFEPPQGENLSNVTKEYAASFTNIHNIVNPSDLVTHVAMRDWGFMRYGTNERVIPSKLTDSNESDFDAMFEKFKLLNTAASRECVVSVDNEETHILNTFKAKKLDPTVKVTKADFGHWEKTSFFGFFDYYDWVPNFDIEVDAHLIGDDTNKAMETFLNDLMLDLSIGFKGRVDYTINLENTVRVVVSEFMGNHNESYKWKEVFPKKFQEKIDAHLMDIAKTYILSGNNCVSTLLTKYLVESLNDSGLNIIGYSEIPNAIITALNDLSTAIVSSIVTNGGEDLITLANNADLLFTAHYPELCLAWLQSQDENYTEDGHRLFVVDCYRVVHINCPVDVEVFDSNGNLLSQLVDDEPKSVSNSNIVVSYTSDGEKLVYLPADADFSLKLKATDDGVLNYSVDEYSYSTSSYVKNVCYYDVPITKGEELSARVNKFSDSDAKDTGSGSNVNYNLNKNGKDLEPTSVLVGEDAAENTFLVSAKAENENSGQILGGGAYTKGSFAQVTALPYENCEFIGWYVNDEPVSKESSYRFRVEKDIELIAKFNGERPLVGEGANELTFKATEGGEITKGADGFYAKDSQTPVEAKAFAGYHFVRWESSDGGKFENANSAGTIFIVPDNKATVTAVFERDNTSKEFTVTFETNGGSKIDSLTVAENTEVDLSKYIPTKDKYSFEGWCGDKKLINILKTIKIDKDITVYAKWKANNTSDANPGDNTSYGVPDGKMIQTGLESGLTIGIVLLTSFVLVALVLYLNECHKRKKK